MKTAANLFEFSRLYGQGRSLIELADHFGIAISTAHDWQQSVQAIWRARMACAVDYEFNQVEQLFAFAWQKLLGSAEGVTTEQTREWTDANGAGAETLRRITQNHGAIGWAKVIQWCIEYKVKMKGGFPTAQTRLCNNEARVAGHTREEIMVKLAERVNLVLAAKQ